MGKRSRSKRSTSNDLPKPEATDGTKGVRTTPAVPAFASAGSTRRRWVFRLLVAVIFPLGLLCGLEMALRLSGFGYSTRFFEPSETPGYLTTNPRFAWQFYARSSSTTPTPLHITAKKAPGTLRIVLLGESAAAGTPDPAYGFARVLEVMLRQQYPSRRIEVINAAMRGINSHIIRPIAEECLDLSPDLFVIYMGNNELIGLHAPSPEEINFTAHLRLLRFGHFLKATRLAQLAETLLRPATSTEARMQDMDYLRRQRLALDDPRRDAVYDNYRANLADICATARHGRVPALVCSVAVNLRDFPPLASLHRRDLSAERLAQWEAAYAEGVAAEGRKEWAAAMNRYEAASALDDHFADLSFRMGTCSAALGKPELALKMFALARDWDALPFRADRRINENAQRTATEHQPDGIHFLDMEQALARSAAAVDGIPGGQLFHEHVHFRFGGDYEAARALFPEVAATLQLGAGAGPLPTREQCAHELAFTPIDDLNVRTAMSRQTARPPFLDQIDHASRQAELERGVQEQLRRTGTADFEQAAAVYREALARAPDDWMYHYNYANLLAQFHQPAAALPEYEFVVNRFPRQRAFRFTYGNTLLQAGHAPQALAQFDILLQQYPGFAPAQNALAEARKKLR